MDLTKAPWFRDAIDFLAVRAHMLLDHSDWFIGTVVALPVLIILIFLGNLLLESIRELKKRGPKPTTVWPGPPIKHRARTQKTAPSQPNPV